MTKTITDTADREIVVSRVVDAPRELVFRMFTDPKHVGKWWGPNGFTTTTHSIDVRPGGAWRFSMHGPDGVDHSNFIVYTEIVKPERLSYHHGEETLDEPGQFDTTITFEDLDGKTAVTLRAIFSSAAERAHVIREHGAIEGGKQTLGRLADYVVTEHGKRATVTAPAGRQETITARVFDAPRELVFKTITDPLLIPRWWGPRYLTTEVEMMEPRPGGRWRFIQRDAQGDTYAFHGVYHSVTPNEGLVQTFEFEGMPGHVILETMILESVGDKTRMTNTGVFQSLADRDGMVASGMEGGAIESMERLAEIMDEA